MLGGWIGQAVGFYGPGEPAGFIMATIGAITLLSIYRVATRQRSLMP
jgi:uncharacterized membrane protein YeaQ/YmgE (transglycosylase-associated protein family)